MVRALGAAPIPFLTDRWLLQCSSIRRSIWKGLGYYMIIYLAALGNVSRDLHEAAALDGAGAVRRFFTVTVPGVRGTMMLVAMLTSVSALRVFSEVFILSSAERRVGKECVIMCRSWWLWYH